MKGWKTALLCSLISLCWTTPSFAGQAEAREVARLNNCTPKKIEVFMQSLGDQGETTYRVSCTAPKLAEGMEATGADAVLVKCNGSLCSYLKPASTVSK